MGSLPYVPHPHDDTKGAAPPLDSPAYAETCSEFLWILPKVRPKNHVSISTNRSIHLFNRAAAEVSLIARPQIKCQNLIQWKRSPKLD